MPILPLFIAAVVLAVIVVAVMAVMAPTPRARTENEMLYRDSVTGELLRFPWLLDSPEGQATSKKVLDTHDHGNPTLRKRNTGEQEGKEEPRVALTVVIPAYNESKRLPSMLVETLDFLESRRKKDSARTFEVIVVDDGSKDDTTEVARKLAKERKMSEVRVLTLEKNRGKGGAVAQGMLVARGDMILFADADGSTKFSDIQQLEDALTKVSKDGLGVAIGSRAHMVKSEAVVKRSAIRNFLMHSFHTILLILGISSIQDTQCGFKLFSRKAAAKIFSNVNVEGWIFDIEVLLLASWQSIPMVEVPVNWHEIEGSKMSLLKDSIVMAMDLLVIRFNYIFGIWRIRSLVGTKKTS
ncbi:dolichyl-phosphate beta-glucosyltransferase [Dinochytrium kinnereticum]|nr:dolichyl-phosphate beta-glucosyltransferase [Dinochytrium kinnereticum]